MWNPMANMTMLDHGRLARKAHERWLTKALRTGRPSTRIPTRQTKLGGFDHILLTPGGREWADKWWADSFNSPDSD